MKTLKVVGVVLAAAACVLLAAGCPRPRLHLVYDQGACGTYGWTSELRSMPDLGHVHQVCDGFVLEEGSATITQVQWWGAYRDDTAVTDDFTLRLYAHVGTGPCSDILAEHHAGAVVRTSTGDTMLREGEHLTVYRYTCTIPVTRLEPDTQYYLAVVNDTGTWVWSNAEGPAEGDGYIEQRYTESGMWTPEAWGDMAFQLWSDRD